MHSSEHPLLQPVKAWIDPPQSQVKGEEKEKKAEEENDKVEENVTFRERLGGKEFLTYGDFLDFCYSREKLELDLISLK